MLFHLQRRGHADWQSYFELNLITNMKSKVIKSCLLITLLFLLDSTKLAAQSCMNISSQVTNSEKHQNISKKGVTNSWTVGDVQDVLNILNKDYNIHNIFFEWDGIVNFTDVMINSSFESDPNFVNHTDGVDIYISADGNMPDGMAVSNGGFQGTKITTAIFVSGTTGFMQQGVYPPYYPAAKTSLISHEMGHLLGLFHIDYKDASGCQEYADGTNSNTCGDYISDTPPINYGYSYNSDNCQYEENTSKLALLYDPLGIKYTSPTAVNDNIMRGGAMFLNCYEKFTPGQGEKMCNVINTNDHLTNTLLSDLTGVQSKQEVINFVVYPNPTDGILTIGKNNIDIPTNEIFIKNVLGNVLKVVSFDAALESINIDLSSLMEGCYFITDERNFAIARVVVK